MYKFETSYLEDTQNGNIVRGFDNYIKGTVARRRAAIGDADRVFSMSSWTYMKVYSYQSNLLHSSCPSHYTPNSFPLTRHKSGTNYTSYLPS